MIETVELTLDEDSYAWRGNVTLTDPAAFRAFRHGSPLTVRLGGLAFNMLVERHSLDVNGESPRPGMSVAVIGATASLAAPWARVRAWSWRQPVMARDAAEQAAGSTPLAWNLVNWRILGGRAVFSQASPMDVITTLANAAGGVVLATPGGGLIVQHRFPVAVPNWQRTPPDHVLTDSADIFSLSESHERPARINTVAVRGSLPPSDSLSLEVDARLEGLNRGLTTFHPGDSVHLLVHAGPTIPPTGITMQTSLGTFHPGPPQEFQTTQEVVFNNDYAATLERHAIRLDSVAWLGRDLGDVTLASDHQTLTAERAGVAVALVTYTSRAHAWSLTIPRHRVTHGSVAVMASGEVETTLDDDVICQRGTGELPGEPISDPLLTSDAAKRSRGRAVIDAGERLQRLSLECRFRQNFMPGQVVELHGGFWGAPSFAKITSVTHAARGPVLVSRLELLKHVPSS